ncbi:MAG: metallophosphoesterase [Firmicutes bacterium]|nr:metallophosphoesterase [Bacillota bacterium]
MRLFAISDLHLPFGADKTMDIFGPEWQNHAHRVAAAWKRVVRPEDVVLVPGDLSWGMRLTDAQPDLDFLGGLPGSIVLVRGNHDYWWQSLARVRQALPPNVFALQNDFYPLPGGLAVCGTRGWTLPGEEEADESRDCGVENGAGGCGDRTGAGEDQAAQAQDRKIYARELVRLELSLQAAVKAGRRPHFAMLHYPPTGARGQETGFTQLLERYRVKLCVYGHLHGKRRAGAVRGVVRGVEYRLVACDAVGFEPVLLWETGAADAGTSAPADARSDTTADAASS